MAYLPGKPALTSGAVALILASMLPSAASAAEYDASAAHPYGRPHPEAPAALADFAFAIGKWSCQAATPQGDGSWTTVPMNWEFRYILNGRAIQDYFEDETIRGMGIRQYNAADGKWHVAYHAMWPNYANAMWVGGKDDDGNIVLDRTITRPDGAEVIMRLSFLNISRDSFDWRGDFVSDEDATTFWQITCGRPAG